nr:hypothetical protein [Entomohabitans teleogrylli]
MTDTDRNMKGKIYLLIVGLKPQSQKTPFFGFVANRTGASRLLSSLDPLRNYSTIRKNVPAQSSRITEIPIKKYFTFIAPRPLRAALSDCLQGIEVS